MARVSGGQRFTVRDFVSCLNFSGTNDIASNSNVAASLKNLTTMTVCAWVRPRSYGDAGLGRIIQKGSGGTPVWGINFDSGSAPNTVTFNARNGKWSVPFVNRDSAREYHHMLFTYDASSAANNPIGYIDGSAKTTTNYGAAGSPVTEDNYISIGNRSGGGRVGNAKIDEVMVFNVILTADQVSELYYKGSVVGVTPIAYWKFDENTGSTASDSSGNGNSLTISGASWSTDVPLKSRNSATNRFLVSDFGTCLSFDGNGDYVEVDRSLITPFDGESTICFWAKLKSKQPSDKPFVDCQWGDNNAGGWQILANANNELVVYVGDNGGRDTSAAQKGLIPGKWQWIAVTKKLSTTTQNVYLNSVLLNSRTNCARGTINPVVSRNLRFAGNRTGGTEMNVFMDDVQIYNKALTQEQLDSIYYRGETPSGLIHKWKFDEGSGTIATDSVGSAHGTITNATYSNDVVCKLRSAV